jgi:dephospho-CoA kinase
VKVIGLTGVFGSGKSTVAGFLADLGADVLDADIIVHQLYEPEAEGWRKVVAIFGRTMLTEDGKIDRRKLAGVVFNDSEALQKLNAAIHPLAARRVKILLEERRRKHLPMVVIEASLLIEAGWASMVDEIWVTTAPREVIFRRLNRKYGLSCREALTRIRKQIPVREQVKHAARVINTDTSLEHLKAKVHRLWHKAATS